MCLFDLSLFKVLKKSGFLFCLFLISCASSDQGGGGQGKFSAQKSEIQVEKLILFSGEQTKVTLRLRDDQGSPFVDSGISAEFKLRGGGSLGVFDPMRNLGSGAYQAIFTGEIAGSPSEVFGVIQGAGDGG